MKKSLIFLCIIVIVSMITFLGKQPTITQEEIFIKESAHNPVNLIQPNASVLMSNADGRLLFQPQRSISSKYENRFFYRLTILENGGATSLLHNDGALGSYEGFLYYYIESPDSTLESEVYAFNLSNRESTFLFKGDISIRDTCFVGEDGMFYIPMINSEDSYYAVKGNDFIGVVSIQNATESGENSFFISTDNNLMMKTPDGEYVHIDIPVYINNSLCKLISCKNGLLIFYPNSSRILDFIPIGSQDVVNLFSTEGRDFENALNIYGTDVYLSFHRYEKLGASKIGMIEYENDTVQGTYRISLIDYSVTKISNKIYNGLYIFDDTGIYACDQYGYIYKLDFDGNVIHTLLS